MALVTCPECKKEMSSTALSCPHCGYTEKSSYSTKNEKRCPKCGSNHVVHTSSGGMGHIATSLLWGPRRANKEYHCLNCDLFFNY